MAKEKVHVLLKETYRRGMTITLNGVLEIIDQNKGKITVELINRGSLSDGARFMTIKLIVAE